MNPTIALLVHNPRAGRSEPGFHMRCIGVYTDAPAAQAAAVPYQNLGLTATVLDATDLFPTGQTGQNPGSERFNEPIDAQMKELDND